MDKGLRDPKCDY